MQTSKFSDLLNKELKNGDYSILASPGYSALVKATEIQKTSPTRAIFTWYDPDGCVLAEAIETDYEHTSLPKLGKVTIKNKKTEYLLNYNKNKTRQFHLRLTKNDIDIIQHLESQENIQGYIKSLIRKDMSEHQGTS